MKYRIKTCLIISFVVFFSGQGIGQINDFQTWTKLDLRLDINKDMEASLEVGQRLRENSLRYDRSLLTANLEYDISDHTEVGGGARYYLVNTIENSVVSRFRLHADVGYSKPLGDFKIGYRHRLQYGFDDIQTIDDYTENTLKSRSRVGMSYRVFGTRFDLQGSYEIFLGIFFSDAVYPVNHRLKIGTSVVLSPSMDLDVSYMLEDEVNVTDPIRAHLLVTSLKWQL